MSGPLWASLPRLWNPATVQRLADVTLGKMLQSSDSGGDVLAPYLRAANIQPDGVLDLTDVQDMWFKPSELSTLDLRVGDVVVVEGGQGGFGRAALVLRTLEGVGFQNSINRLRPRDDHDGRFLAYYLIALRASGFIRAYCNIVSMPHLTSEKLAAIPVPAPPPVVQRAIADFLDRETAQIDTLIAEQQRLVDLLHDRRQSMVDSRLRLDSSSVMIPLKHIVERFDQGVSPQAESAPADGRSVGVLKSGCVNGGNFRDTENKRLPDSFRADPGDLVGVGDLIVSRASGSPRLVGSAAIVESLRYKLILSDKTYRLRLRSNVDSRYLMWCLNSHWYRQQVLAVLSGAEGLANNLPLTRLKAFRFPVPSLREQRAAAADLDSASGRINELSREVGVAIRIARERRAALITAAVTGQIDVRDMAA